VGGHRGLRLRWLWLGLGSGKLHQWPFAATGGTPAVNLAAAALALALVAPIPAAIFADIDRGFLRVD